MTCSQVRQFQQPVPNMSLCVHAVCDAAVYRMHQCFITARVSEEHPQGVLHAIACVQRIQSKLAASASFAVSGQRGKQLPSKCLACSSIADSYVVHTHKQAAPEARLPWLIDVACLCAYAAWLSLAHLALEALQPETCSESIARMLKGPQVPPVQDAQVRCCRTHAHSFVTKSE